MVGRALLLMQNLEHYLTECIHLHVADGLWDHLSTRRGGPV